MAERLDQLTKALATTHSRRQALKLIGGGLLGALGAVAGIGSAAAAGGVPCGPTTCPPGWICVTVNGYYHTCAPATYCTDYCANLHGAEDPLFSECVATCYGAGRLG